MVPNDTWHATQSSCNQSVGHRSHFPAAVTEAHGKDADSGAPSRQMDHLPIAGYVFFSLLPSSLPPSLSPPPLSLAPFLHLSPSVPPSLGVLPSSPPSCAFFRARALSRARVLALLLSRSLVLLLFHSLTLARSRERYLSLSRFPLPSSWPPLVLPLARSLALLFARDQSHLFAVH
jgi:hypothetical protein